MLKAILTRIEILYGTAILLIIDLCAYLRDKHRAAQDRQAEWAVAQKSNYVARGMLIDKLRRARTDLKALDDGH